MKQTLSAVGLAMLFLLTWALPVGAQVPDHLKCYKVKDPIAKGAYTADLGGLAPEAGCVIKLPGKLLCVETTKTNVSPPPPGAAPGNPAGQFLCYKVKCPKVKPPGMPWTDQFGGRTLQPAAPKMLCAPRAVSTTTTTSSTTTTLARRASAVAARHAGRVATASATSRVAAADAGRSTTTRSASTLARVPRPIAPRTASAVRDGSASSTGVRPSVAMHARRCGPRYPKGSRPRPRTPKYAGVRR